MGDAIEEAQRTLVYVRHAVDMTRIKHLHDPVFVRRLGNLYPMFLYRLAQVEASLDRYEDALGFAPPPPPIAILGVGPGVSTRNPIRLLGSLIVAAIISSRASIVSSRGRLLPQGLAEAEEALGSALQGLRDTMPADLAGSFLPYGTLDYRVLLASTQRAYLAAQAAAALATVLPTADEVTDLLGMGKVATGKNAAVVAIAKAIQDLEKDKEGVPPHCEGLRKDFLAKSGRAFNVTLQAKPSALVKKNAWTNFVDAALAYVKCLLGDPPAAKS